MAKKSLGVFKVEVRGRHFDGIDFQPWIRRGDVELFVDVEALGSRALRNKSQSTSLAGGLIAARVVKGTRKDA